MAELSEEFKKEASEIKKELQAIARELIAIGDLAAKSPLPKTLKEQRAATTDLVKAEERLKKVNTDISAQVTRINVLTQERNKQLKQEARESLGLVSAYDKLNRQRAEAAKRLKDLIASERASNKEIKQAQREFDTLDKKVRKANKAAKDGSQDVGRYTQAWGKFKNILAGGGIILGLTTVFNLLKSGVTIIKNYTTANSTLQGVLNKTAKETESLRKQQKELGATTAFSASEVTKAQTELARLGLSMKQITDLTPAILDGAVALGVDMAPAAELVAGQLNAYGLAATEGKRVTDALVRATQISAFNFERLQTSLGIVSPAAKAAGASLEETLGILTAAVDANIDASSAGTALRNIFIDLAGTGKTWKDAMEEIKGSTDRLGKANELFGKRGAVVAAVIAENTDKIDENKEALEGAAGAAKAFADTQLDNLEGDVKLLTSAWEGFVLSLEEGDGWIAKLLRGFVKLTTSVLSFATITEGSAKAIEDEQKELNILATKIQLTNEGTEDRIELIKELQKKYPKLLKNIEADKVSNEQLAAAMHKANKQFIAKIVLARKEDEIAKQREKVADSAEFLTNKQIEFQELLAKAVQNGAKIHIKAGQSIKESYELIEKARERGEVGKFDFFKIGQVYAAIEAQKGLAETKLDALKDLESEYNKIEKNLGALLFSDGDLLGGGNNSGNNGGGSGSGGEDESGEDESKKAIAIARRRREALREIQSEQLDYEIELLEKTRDNEEASLLERLEANELVTQKKIELARIAMRGQLDSEKALLKEEKDLIQQGFQFAEEKAKQAEQKIGEDILSGILSGGSDDDLLADLEKGLNARLDLIDKAMNEELIANIQNTDNLADLEKAQYETEKKFREKSIKDQIAFLKNKLALFKLEKDEEAALLKKISELELSLLEDSVENTKRTEEEKRLIKEVSKDLALEISNSLFTIAADRVDAELDLLSAQHEKESEDREIRKEAAIAAAGENKTAIAGIEADFRKQQLAADRQVAAQQAQLKRKAAIADKANALFQIGINTAENIAKFAGNPILVALVAAIGAAQAAAVIARPLPKFKKGTTKTPDTFIAGDGGRELVVTKEGEAFVTPSKDTVYTGMEGAMVLPHPKTEEILGTLQDARLPVGPMKLVENEVYDWAKIEEKLEMNNYLMERLINKPYPENLSERELTRSMENAVETAIANSKRFHRW